MYDADFYDATNEGSLRSAAAVLPIVAKRFRIKTVVDFGCGQGAWLSVWKKLGATVCGIDGDYVRRESLLIDPGEFMPGDLSRPVNLGKTFDLVQSLEVAEHLPESSAETFVDTLLRHGRLILFAAAVPGQMGIAHVNERPYTYWRDLFARRGYEMFDLIRPAVRGNTAVDSWYRYNTFLFAERSRTGELPAEVRAWRLDTAQRIPDMAPLWLRGVRVVTRQLPVSVSTRIASWSNSRAARRRRG